ncbi:MAG: HNH endonuclease [Deltaproteobacteria bacterium]|nr:HNH endonuclease [Deltaproteobacteria bacterium]
MGDFSEKDKIRCLLWCNRHCCLCGKACGTDIEIAHINPKKKKGSDHIDNAIPLCYDCHSEIGRYNKEHPRGNKYRPKELKARREQIYEQHTRHLVPPIFYEITQIPPNGQQWKFPKVAFVLTHLGDSLPVKVLVVREIFLGKRSLGVPNGGHYSGKVAWNMNPRMTAVGVIKVPPEAESSTKRLYIRVTATVIDQYEREHKLLPTGWVYNRAGHYWALEP